MSVSGSVTPMGCGESTATESEAGDSEAAEPVRESEYSRPGDQNQFTSASYGSTSYDGRYCTVITLI